MRMTLQEAAQKWGVSESTIRNWIREGRVSATPLSEVLKSQGLPATKRDSWIINQPDRPPMNTQPIVREKVAVIDDDGGLPASEPGAPTMQGFWNKW